MQFRKFARLLPSIEKHHSSVPVRILFRASSATENPRGNTEKPRMGVEMKSVG